MSKELWGKPRTRVSMLSMGATEDKLMWRQRERAILRSELGNYLAKNDHINEAYPSEDDLKSDQLTATEDFNKGNENEYS